METHKRSNTEKLTVSYKWVFIKQVKNIDDQMFDKSLILETDIDMW